MGLCSVLGCGPGRYSGLRPVRRVLFPKGSPRYAGELGRNGTDLDAGSLSGSLDFLNPVAQGSLEAIGLNYQGCGSLNQHGTGMFGASLGDVSQGVPVSAGAPARSMRRTQTPI